MISIPLCIMVVAGMVCTFVSGYMLAGARYLNHIRVLRSALQEQHDWQLIHLGEVWLPDGQGEFISISNADEYGDSAMFERTTRALAL